MSFLINILIGKARLRNVVVSVLNWEGIIYEQVTDTTRQSA